MIRGLGSQQKAFVYLDDYITMPIDWHELHTQTCKGLAYATWEKRFVSSGVHPEWSDKEITPYMKEAKKWLTEDQVEILASLPSSQEKIKFMMCVFPVAHPFWVMYIRNNKRVEQTGIANKADASQCFWTDNAKHFPHVMRLIEHMPFESIGRVMCFMTEANNNTVPHYDASTVEQRNAKPNDDFIWFTTQPSPKSLFVMDGDTKEKTYNDPTKKFVWFNEMDFHGTESMPYFTFSLRVEGKFKSDVKKELMA